jgi:hypothetical protein
LAAFGWSAGLAVLSLFLVRSDADDTQYVRLSTWIAERGELPLRDFLFSDQAFPAIFYPPLSSFEALAGVVARGTGVSAPGVVYLVVPPVASALAVLATWRLLRAWRVRMVGLALSTALVFLLMAAQDHRTLGNFFVGRMWQGKVVFLTVLVPLLFVLLLDYARRPARHRLLLLGAAGAAAVGLTSTGAFLVPLLAAGCLAPLALRARREAFVGLAAVAAYPVGALVVTAAVGSRRAGAQALDLAAGDLAHFVLGSGLFSFIAVCAVLLGPLVLGSRRGALMATGVVLVAFVVFAPGLPRLVWEVTGVGQVLWRVAWIVPVAALVGALATGLSARLRPRGLATAAPLLLCSVLVASGAPVWEDGIVASKPSWKRFPTDLSEARRILAETEPGAVVLAPSPLTGTLVILSSDVTTVAPRRFYAEALEDVPESHGEERLLLQAAIEGRPPPDAAELARALRVVGVDLACAYESEPAALEALGAVGYEPAFAAGRVTCLRPSPEER